MERIFEKIVNNLIQHKTDFFVLTFLLIVAPLFTYLESITSLFSWFLSLGVLFLFVRFYKNLIYDNNSFKTTLLISFFVLSILGLIMAFDNYQNFNELFASRHDDSDFFYTIIDTINSNNPDTEKWLFEYFFAMIGFGIGKIHFYRELQLLDLLPFTWAMAALTVALSAEIAKRIVGKAVPIWIVFASLLGNYVFITNSVVFYRESMVLMLAFSGWLYFLQKKTREALIFSFFAGLLRGANAMLNLFFYFLLNLTKNNQFNLFRKSYIFLFFTLIITLSLVKPMVDQYAYVIYSWARPFDVATETESRMYGATIDDIIETRQYDVTERSTGGQIAGKAGGTIKLVLDIIMYMFFPVAFHPVVYGAQHTSVNYSIYVTDAFFVFSFIEWMMVLCWIIVIPYLLYGIYNAAKQNSNPYLTSTTILYILTVLILAVFRGHTRHAMYFIMLNPIFVTYGYYLTKEKLSSKRIVIFLKISTILAIVGYNFFKYS